MKCLGLGVSEVDWTTPFDFVVRGDRGVTADTSWPELGPYWKVAEDFGSWKLAQPGAGVRIWGLGFRVYGF